MKNISFPLTFTFHIGTLANDFTATDANETTIAYVRQKMFKLKEDIVLYSDRSKTDILFQIKADTWLDFSTAYSFTDTNHQEIGKIVRKGWKSIWKAEYELIDQFQKSQYTIKEESAWVKVLDHFLGGIPILGLFTGYFFNPSYLVQGLQDQPIARLKKNPSFLGQKFTIEKVGTMDSDDESRIMLGLMMLILLEKRRG